MRGVLAAAVGIAALLVSGPARADESDLEQPPFDPPSRSGPKGERSNRLQSGKWHAEEDLGLVTFDAFVSRQVVPSLGVNDDATPRRLVGAPTPAANATLVGGGVWFRLRWEALVLPIAGIRYAQSAGAEANGGATANESEIQVRRGDVHVIQLDAPLFLLPTGFQVFGDRGSWKVNPTVAVGAQYMWTGATILAADGTTIRSTADSWSGYVRGEFAVCLRTDQRASHRESATWGCAVASEVFYDSRASAFSATSLGLRVDL